MDYNYVRMRNAIKDGDFEKAQYYRGLYESGKNKSKSIAGIDIAILVTLVLSMLLGIYILHSETKLAELNVEINKTEATPIPVVGEGE